MGSEMCIRDRAKTMPKLAAPHSVASICRIEGTLARWRERGFCSAVAGAIVVDMPGLTDVDEFAQDCGFRLNDLYGDLRPGGYCFIG